MISDYFSLFLRTNLSLFRSLIGLERLRLYATFQQAISVGVNSLPTVCLATFFMGLVFTMQGAAPLEAVGSIDRVAELVAVSMLREVGPLITAVVVIGRSGSAITAELGTMKVSEEIEALEVMAIDPVRFLVVPRYLAMVVMLPVVTLLGEMTGLFGGWLLGVATLGLDPYTYVSNMVASVDLEDLYSGLIKAFIFGALISSIACFFGIQVKGGAEGVGRNTTTSVVVCLVSMLAMDALLTAIFFYGVDS
ncbi:MAG: ABC transporter permease [Verrucomicrobiota bacterium]